MNRRGFLSAILAAGAAPYVMSGGIGREVLMPVRRIIVPEVDAVQALMSYTNNLMTIDMITREALLIMEKNIAMARDDHLRRSFRQYF